MDWPLFGDGSRERSSELYVPPTTVVNVDRCVAGRTRQESVKPVGAPGKA